MTPNDSAGSEPPTAARQCVKQTNDITTKLYHDILRLRFDVFIDELGVAAATEVENEDACEYFAVVQGEKVLASVRARTLSDGSWQVERLVTKKNTRHHGCAHQLLESVVTAAKLAGCKRIVAAVPATLESLFGSFGYKAIVCPPEENYNMQYLVE